MPRFHDDEQRFRDLLHPLLIAGRNDFDLDGLSKQAGINSRRGQGIYRQMRTENPYRHIDPRELRLVPPVQTGPLSPVQQSEPEKPIEETKAPAKRKKNEKAEPVAKDEEPDTTTKRIEATNGNL